MQRSRMWEQPRRLTQLRILSRCVPPYDTEHVSEMPQEAVPDAAAIEEKEGIWPNKIEILLQLVTATMSCQSTELLICTAGNYADTRTGY